MTDSQRLTAALESHCTMMRLLEMIMLEYLADMRAIEEEGGDRAV